MKIWGAAPPPRSFSEKPFRLCAKCTVRDTVRDTVPEIRFLNYSSPFTQIDVAAQIEVGLHNISYFSEMQ